MNQFELAIKYYFFTKLHYSTLLTSLQIFTNVLINIDKFIKFHEN